MIQPDLDFTAKPHDFQRDPLCLYCGQPERMHFGESRWCNQLTTGNRFTVDSQPTAHARKSDPQTSHEAAASVRGITRLQAAIMDLFEQYGQLADERMLEFYRRWEKSRGYPKASDSGLRSRRAELVTDNFLRDSGKREKTKSGRNSVVWEIVK